MGIPVAVAVAALGVVVGLAHAPTVSGSALPVFLGLLMAGMYVGIRLVLRWAPALATRRSPPMRDPVSVVWGLIAVAALLWVGLLWFGIATHDGFTRKLGVFGLLGMCLPAVLRVLVTRRGTARRGGSPPLFKPSSDRASVILLATVIVVVLVLFAVWIALNPGGLGPSPV